MKENNLVDLHNHQEVESQKFTLKKLSIPSRLQRKTTGKVEDLKYQKESLNDLLEKKADYNGKYDKEANKFTADAKGRYIKSDRAYYDKTKNNMRIHSGKRTVARQAELFILHTWHNQGNKANWPGCSLHNWGLAADMVRTNEKDMVNAMSSTGWNQTVVDEGWHFECVGSPDYNSSISKIASFRREGSGLAFKWSKQVAHYYIKTRKYNKRLPIYNQRKENHLQNMQILQSDVENFNAEMNNFKQKVDRLNKDVENYNNELARLRILRDDINAMPQGPERNREIREYNQLSSWVDSESGRLEQENSIVEQENNRLSIKSASLDSRIKSFEQEASSLTNELKELKNISKEISKHKTSANQFLVRINQAVA